MVGDRIPIVGFLGGIGSGKSSLAAWLGERVRVAVLDADTAGHAALREARVKEELRTRFGDRIFDSQGEVLRSRLAALVFGDTPEQVEQRQQLEQVVHPVIRERLQQSLQQLQATGDVDLIVLDAAIMLEAGWSDLCDVLLYLDVPAAVREERVVRSRGWSSCDLRRREASQWPLERKRAAADEVIDNSANLEGAGERALSYLQSRFPGFASRLSHPPAAAAPATACSP